MCEIWRIERESNDSTNSTRLKKKRKKIRQAELESCNNGLAASDYSMLLSCNNLKK